MILKTGPSETTDSLGISCLSCAVRAHRICLNTVLFECTTVCVTHYYIFPWLWGAETSSETSNFYCVSTRPIALKDFILHNTFSTAVFLRIIGSEPLE